MNLQRKRVVVTGMGHLSSIASNIDEFKQALYDKKCGIKPSKKYLPFFDGANASEILQDLTYEGLSQEQIKNLDNAALWAYKVGYEALKNGKVDDPALRVNMGLIIGVSSAGTEAYIPIIEHRYENFSLGKSLISGSFSSCSSIVAALLNIQGGFELIATACTASTNALGMGFDNIQNNKNKYSLIIGTEPLYLPTFAGFYTLKAMKKTPSSPFSGEPGMSIGEGAGAILIEEYEHAVARGATIYGEIISYATSGDAYHETAPDPLATGAVQVMNKAMENAGITPQDIQYINAHGTGTDANDRSETLAMKKVFPNIASIPVSSTKSYVGHNIGSAGIIELVACLLTLKEDKILPTLNFTTPRQNCDLNYVPNEFQEGHVKMFMKNNYAFGGNNCSIIASPHFLDRKISRYQPKRVAITGIGLISSLGHNYTTIMSRLWNGDNAATYLPIFSDEEEKLTYRERLKRIQVFDSKNGDDFVKNYTTEEKLNNTIDGFTYTHRVVDLDPRKYLRRFDPRKAIAISTYALLAVTQSMKHAQRKIKRDGQNIGLILGMSKGPQEVVARFLDSIYPDPNKVRTSEFPNSLMNAVATFCSISEGIKGYNTTLATGYNAGVGALTYSYELIRQSLQPQVITGGADEIPAKEVVHIMSATGALQVTDDNTAFRVYDKESKGYLMGEGAGILFLEDYQHALDRNVPIQAEIIGYGKANDTTYFDFNATDPKKKSVAMTRAIYQAFNEAKIDATQVDLVCGSSHGTALYNEFELEAIHTVFSKNNSQIPVVNYCGYFGFIESCSGILNIATIIEIMRRGEILPIPYTKSFIRDDLSFVTEPLKKQVSIALVLASTEGGNHYAILLKKGNVG